ncbi:MAG: PrsW family glutamic-type intramembrane protease [Bacteroidales bacterium]
MQAISLISILQTPLLLILIFIFFKTNFKVNRWKYIFQAFGFGLITVLFLVFVDFVAELLGYDALRNLKRSAFYSFAIIGGGSEIGKFLLLRYYFIRLKSVKGPYESILYSVIISLAFTMVAIPLYINGFFSTIPSDLFLLTYPLANILFAIILGFFVGLGKSRKNRLIDSFTGLGAASFFHGFFYFSNLASDRTILWLFGIGILFIASLLAVKSMNLKRDEDREEPEYD